MKPLTYPQTAQLCRSLALLLNAGIPLADGLFLLAREEGSSIATLSAFLGQKLDQGQLLSEAMEESGVFSSYVTGMVRVGEVTGRLENALQTLADYYELRQHTIRQLRQMLAYPSMLLALMLLVIGVLLVKVLPVFDRVYASFGSRLTGAGAYLLHLGQWLEDALPVLLGILAVCALFALLFCCWDRFRGKTIALFLRFFGDKGVLGKFHRAHFVHALATGVSSGLSASASTDLATTLQSNIPGIAKQQQILTEQLASGNALPDALMAARLLSPAQGRLLALGIRSGNGDQVLQQIAQALMEEAEEALSHRISQVEPTMVLTASILVGWILLTVMLPLMNIMTTIG